MILGTGTSHVNYTLYTSDAYAKYKGETTLFAAQSNQQFGHDGEVSSEYAGDVAEWIQGSRRQDNIYGTIDIPDYGTVTIYNSGVLDLKDVPRTEEFQLDWKHIDSAEDRANAILENYPGSTLTIAETAVSTEAQNDRYVAFLNSIMSSDALAETYLNSSSLSVPVSTSSQDDLNIKSDETGEYMLATNRWENAWGTINVPGMGTVTIYNGGGTSYDGSPGDIDIDWENIDTAEGRAAAIMAKYGGDLIMAETAVRSNLSIDEGDSLDYLKTVMEDDALFKSYLASSVGQSIEETLRETADL